MREDCQIDIDGDIDQASTLFQKGLPPSQFWELFVECAACGHVLPRYRYPYAHRCQKRARGPEEPTGRPSTSTVSLPSPPPDTGSGEQSGGSLKPENSIVSLARMIKARRSA
jgi:hypothetical protein